MGRFESPCQVLGLFIAASVVSVGIIFFVNAEAHNRLASRNEADFGDSTVETNDGSGEPLSLPLSSSKFDSSSTSWSSSKSSELTSSYATDSNYSKNSNRFPSPRIGLDGGVREVGAVVANVTLLNFLEDGLEKLLSIIKEAKNTYKSYYLNNHVRTTNSGPTSPTSVTVTKEAVISVSSQEDGGEDNGSSPSSRSSGDSGLEYNYNYNQNHPRRRRKREVMDTEERNKSHIKLVDGADGRSKRAVISQSKRRKIGENEPYYWQMLEDNNGGDNHHNHQNQNQQHQNQHQHQHHQQHHREKEEEQQQRDRSRLELGSSSGGRGHYSNSQYPHYYHPHHNPQSESRDQNHFGSSSLSIPGQAPAVASAFTGGADTILHSVHNPTSDFHKIRHAMNKLGGGGLDISVVERMILDTKSSGRSHSSPGGSRDQQKQQKQEQNHFNVNKGGGGGNSNPGRGRSSPVSLNGNSHLMNHREGDSSSMPASSLLTTAITKTTQQGRQDESVYVNQLRHHQQQLAQSLLPPTVTWLNEGGGGGGSVGESTAVRYLPLPSSSLATGSGHKDDHHLDNDKNNSDEDEEDGRNNQDNNDVDDDDDSDNEGDRNENSVSSSTKRRSKESRRKIKLKRKKFEKAQRRNNNELSYSPQPSSSSSMSNEVDEDDDDTDYTLYGGGKQGNNNNRNNDNSDNDNNSNSYGDIQNNVIMGDDDDDENEDDNDDEEEELEESKRAEEDGDALLVGNSSPPPTPPHDGRGHNGKDCYHTDDVLIVVAITCCLNFAFVLVIWALVRWFSISSNPKEKDFQNLGDCDDTLDPTIVFHGVNEDPCWTLATSAGSNVPKEGASSSGLMTSRNSNLGGGGIGAVGGGGVGVGCSSGGGVLGGGANIISVGGGLGGGVVGSIHSVNKVDLFPTMGKIVGGNHGGSSLGNSMNIGGAPVMTMTAERRLPYQNNLHIGSGGIIGLGMGQMVSIGGGANVYSFKPEHVPAHHGSSGTMHRSYSQSMEDLRYVQ